MDNHIQIFHLGRNIVGYTFGNHVLRLRSSVVVKPNFRLYIRRYNYPNEKFEYGYPLTILYHFSTTSVKQWIQVDFLQPKLVSGIITQGLPNVDRWSHKFFLSTSLDGLSFTPYSETAGGVPKIFDGNTDRDSIIRHMLNRNVEARYVRLIVTEGGPDGIGMRFNLIGCYSNIPSRQTTTGQTVTPGMGGTNTPTAVPPFITQIIPGNYCLL